MVQETRHEDYARKGALCTGTVTLPAGPVVGPGGRPFAHTMEHTLGANGLPSKLSKAVIELRCEHTVCCIPHEQDFIVLRSPVSVNYQHKTLSMHLITYRVIFLRV
jgi:hypothetical protein